MPGGDLTGRSPPVAQHWLATRPPSQVVLFRRRTLAWSDGILACQAGSRAGRGRLRGHSCLCPRSRCSTERQKRLVSGPRGCTAPWCHTGRCPPHHRRRSPSPRLIWRAAAVQVRTRITIRGRPRHHRRGQTNAVHDVPVSAEVLRATRPGTSYASWEVFTDSEVAGATMERASSSASRSLGKWARSCHRAAAALSSAICCV